MRSTATDRILLTTIAAALLLAAGTVGTSHAGLRVEASYSSQPVDVRVWLDRGYDDYYGDADIEEIGSYYDVYPSANDVVLYIRAARSCYTTVYVIDTEGFIHVIHPLSPYDDAYLLGGRVYRLWLRDYGFHRACFGRGVAFAFAVSSPVPFAYASYGLGVFGPHIGFQIYGDPFIAARLFYQSILPPAYHRGFVSVSYARFYVREYVRYPSYLCLGWCDPHGARTYCAGGCGAHRQYRVHAKDPYRFLRPSRDAEVAEKESVGYTRITRTGVKDASDVRVSKTAPGRAKDVSDTRVSKNIQGRVKDASEMRARKTTQERVAQNVVEPARPAARVKDPVAEQRVRQETPGATRLVRSTKDTYVTSKKDYEKMREIYEKSEKSGAREIREVHGRSGDQDRVQVRPAPAKTPAGAGNVKATKVNRRAVNDARETVALGDASSREKPKSGKGAKRSR